MRYVLLDTNIIQYISVPILVDQIINNLNEAVQAGYGLAFSDFSFFELLDGSRPEIEAERISALGKMKHFRVTKRVLIAAAHLGCLYKENGQEKNDNGDKIIAATALMSDSIIYTVNGRDFPRPYFTELVTRELKYTDGDVEKWLKAYFLKPDAAFIAKEHGERVKQHKQKTKRQKRKTK